MNATAAFLFKRLEDAMSPEREPDANNPAQVKGDINASRSGDKRPGFDPAAAPLETDSEAGGTSLSSDQVATARKTQRQNARLPEDVSYGSAMRPVGNVPTGSRTVLLIAALLVAIFAIAGLLLVIG
jgi:hypothetical protein